MKTLRIRQFHDDLLGVPVEIEYVDVLKEPHDDTPLINYESMGWYVLDEVVNTRRRLTGDEIRFIRTMLDFTYQDFAKRLGCTHPAVKHWEEQGRSPSRMVWSTEKDIRLLAMSRLRRPAKASMALFAAMDHPSDFPEVTDPPAFKVPGDIASTLKTLANTQPKRQRKRSAPRHPAAQTA